MQFPPPLPREQTDSYYDAFKGGAFLCQAEADWRRRVLSQDEYFGRPPSSREDDRVEITPLVQAVRDETANVAICENRLTTAETALAQARKRLSQTQQKLMATLERQATEKRAN
jgi:hypothetical protein